MFVITAFERDETSDDVTCHDLTVPELLPEVVVEFINDTYPTCDPIRYRSHRQLADGTVVVAGTFDDERPVHLVLTYHPTDQKLAWTAIHDPEVAAATA